jgi:hypothetical protein
MQIYLLVISLFVMVSVSSDIGLDVYTLDNQPISIADSTVAIVMYGPVSCSSCFGQLTRVIRATDSSLKIVGLLKPASRSVVDRRLMLQRARKLFTADRFVFDEVGTSSALDSASGGIFGRYRVYQTPCLILRRGGQLHFYDFKSMFHGDDSTNTDVDYLEEAVRAIVKGID